VPSDRPAGKEVSPVSRRDKAGNTAQAARGKATRGGWGGCRESVCPGCGRKKKANLKQAGEKLKDTANK
jgi:hypothetical protein